MKKVSYKVDFLFNFCFKKDKKDKKDKKGLLIDENTYICGI